MGSITRRAIMTSFIKILEAKPLSQITIREIVEKCGVNRNTFYYYFPGIPELVESMINEETDAVIKKFPKVDSLEECMDSVIAFALKNKRAVLHIYNSVSRDLYEQYQWRVCDYAMRAYLNQILIGYHIKEEDKQLLIDYMRCLSFGFVMNWMESGMEDGLSEKFHRLFEMKQGELDRMIAFCENKM